jgi:hypothetical protein
LAANQNITKKLLVIAGAFLVSYLIVRQLGKANLKAATADAPANFPSNLKSLFEELKSKGYNPKATPADAVEPLVMFSIETSSANPLQVDVDQNNIVSITYSPNTPVWRAIYSDGVFTQNNKIVAESSDLLSGILQIIANKDYIL